jgi:hypothetical protein
LLFFTILPFDALSSRPLYVSVLLQHKKAQRCVYRGNTPLIWPNKMARRDDQGSAMATG